MSEFKMVEAGKNARLTLVNLHKHLKENPITYKEALFLGWISLEDGYSKLKMNEVKKHSSIITKLDVDDAEVALSRPLSAARMVAGLNYLNYLKSIKGSILPPDFEEALTTKQLKITSTSSGLLKYIACWFPGYSVENSIVEPSELEESSLPCLCDDVTTLPQSYTGTVYSTEVFTNWWLLPSETPFYDMLLACSTGWDKEKSAFQVNNHTWVNWNSEEKLVSLVNKQRMSRSVYTIRGVENFFVEDPMMLWGNFLIQFIMNGGTEEYISLLINRDTTDLLTPSVVYGDVSPLNHAVNHDTVGHLEIHLNRPSDAGCTVGFDFRNDKQVYSPVEAATVAMQKGYPVLFQHQLEKVRIGKGAQALGKSTLTVYVKLDKDTFIEGTQYPAGTLVPVSLILGQDEVDKPAKLFNRDALCVRVTPGVKILFPEGFLTSKGEEIANDMKDFAANLLAD